MNWKASYEQACDDFDRFKVKSEQERAVLRAALKPFAAKVHDDGDDAPYPEDEWSPLLLAAKQALEM